MSAKAEARQKFQVEFVNSGKELSVGSGNNLPMDVKKLCSTTESSPWVARYFGGGLTAEVFKVEAGGKFYTLKKKRDKILVHNVDGQTSFLNEVQRRHDFEALKRKDPEGYSGIVDTIYASLNNGIILSPWIEGDHISGFTPDIFEQIFKTLISMELGGVFEYDPTGGNLLLSADGKVLMYDFGYAYPFDPRVDINPDGKEVPVFHAAERFETRCFMQHLMDVGEYIGREKMMMLYRMEKESALKAYTRKINWLEQNNGDADILGFVRTYIELWSRALADTAELEKTYFLESFRSYVLDLHDDISGKSCTFDTIRKAEKALQIIGSEYDFIKRHNGFFWGDEKLSKKELLFKYAALGNDAHKWQIAYGMTLQEWSAHRTAKIRNGYRETK